MVFHCLFQPPPPFSLFFSIPHPLSMSCLVLRTLPSCGITRPFPTSSSATLDIGAFVWYYIDAGRLAQATQLVGSLFVLEVIVRRSQRIVVSPGLLFPRLVSLALCPSLLFFPSPTGTRQDSDANTNGLRRKTLRVHGIEGVVSLLSLSLLFSILPYLSGS